MNERKGVAMEEKLPEFLKKRLEGQYGKEKLASIIKGYQAKRKTTFRRNTLKASQREIEDVLQENQIEFEKVEWSNEAYLLKNASEREIKSLSIYEEGKIYLQSLSSMLPPIVLEPKEGMDILDMTSAPGGKTTQMAMMTKNCAHITACEMNKIRAERLKYNLEKQGAKVYVMNEDARKIDDFFSFDQILLDAPCSGSGTIQLENPKLQSIFTERLVEKSVNSQISLLQKAICLLKPKKEMVYSTCSILLEENEQVIQTIAKQKEIEIIPIHFEGMEKLPLLPTQIKGTLCVCPNEQYEGFFVAKIRKL